MYYTILDSKWTVTECLKERKRGLSASFINFKLFLEFIDSELPLSTHHLI